MGGCCTKKKNNPQPVTTPETVVGHPPDPPATFARDGTNIRRPYLTDEPIRSVVLQPADWDPEGFIDPERGISIRFVHSQFIQDDGIGPPDRAPRDMSVCHLQIGGSVDNLAPAHSDPDNPSVMPSNKNL